MNKSTNSTNNRTINATNATNPTSTSSDKTITETINITDSRSAVASVHTPASTSRQSQWQGFIPYISLLYIWGAQWVLVSAIELAFPWQHLSWLRPMTSIVALVFSLLAIFRAWNFTRNMTRPANANETLKLLLPILLILASIWVFQYTGIVNQFYVDVWRAIILAIVYVQLGLSVSWRLVALGLWLFALAAIMAIFYLGFTPIIMEFCSGLSMIAAGWMLQRAIPRLQQAPAH